MNRGRLTLRQCAFLAAYGLCGCVTFAARYARISRRSHYAWLQTSEDYASSFSLARDEAGDMLEAEARRRAVDGTPRKAFTADGQPVIDPETGLQYVERQYSDMLLIVLLRAARPEKFKERVQLEHERTDEEIDAEIADLSGRKFTPYAHAREGHVRTL